MIDVLVAGAGIGGLTAALSLHAAGIGVRVVDPVDELRPVGVGVDLLPYAVGELTQLGLGGGLAATAVAPEAAVHFDRHGERVGGEPCGLALGHPWPRYSLHRGALQLMLLDAVRDRLGDHAVRTGTAFVRLAEREGAGLRVILRDMERGREYGVGVRALVGADGLHSAVRATLHPGEGPPLWSGVRMWRGITEWLPVLGGQTIAMAADDTAKFVVHPVSRQARERGRALLSWVAEVRFPPAHHQAVAGPADWNRSGRLSDVLPHFAGWRMADLDVPALIAGTRQILECPMVDRDPLARWGRGPVTLLGDAAHPMCPSYPVGSESGSQAVLDARALGQCLAYAGADREAGLRHYEDVRGEAANAVVLAARSGPWALGRSLPRPSGRRGAPGSAERGLRPPMPDGRP
ncbi:FAD-dependent monooxygenase [Streptomyces alfalfae]|uniref:FAD-dependent monooxygenase n=1 Tax=Streptomyces alfalfae TaxID=1642299 RepID=A0A7T4PFI7_9ACTN|nr:FAD-dependent monooxygenase [Streptomyces alfalfae]QQC89326.1 FAD-dependent monooxygenase [Streptomyces alfalfae]